VDFRKESSLSKKNFVLLPDLSLPLRNQQGLLGKWEDPDFEEQAHWAN
jgi:hypothetical protein